MGVAKAAPILVCYFFGENYQKSEIKTLSTNNMFDKTFKNKDKRHIGPKIK